MEQDRIIAVGLLTRRDLQLLGPTFDRLWPVEDFQRESQFEELLRAIDQADERMERRRLEMPPEPHQ